MRCGCMTPKLNRPWKGPFSVIKEIKFVFRIQQSPRSKPKVLIATGCGSTQGQIHQLGLTPFNISECPCNSTNCEPINNLVIEDEDLALTSTTGSLNHKKILTLLHCLEGVPKLGNSQIDLETHSNRAAFQELRRR